MKKIIMGMLLAVSLASASHAGSVNVTIDPIKDIPVELDSRINIEELTMTLYCSWNPNLYHIFTQDNPRSVAKSEEIELKVSEIDGKHYISTEKTIAINENRMTKNDLCELVVWSSVSLKSDPEIKSLTPIHSTIELSKMNGNLTAEVIKKLSNRQIKEEGELRITDNKIWSGFPLEKIGSVHTVYISKTSRVEAEQIFDEFVEDVKDGSIDLNHEVNSMTLYNSNLPYYMDGESRSVINDGCIKRFNENDLFKCELIIR